LAAVAFAVGLLGLCGRPAAAQTVSSTVPQFVPPPILLSSPTFDVATYNFAGQDYQSLSSITSLSVRLTLDDGDSGGINFDVNDLSFELDGIATGIVLNGFYSNQELTLTFDKTAPANADAILAALKADGILVGSIRDADPGDNQFMPIASGTTSTLVLNGTTASVNPEPTSVALLLPGLAALGVVLRRRRHAAS
jgi:hypothetical protein